TSRVDPTLLNDFEMATDENGDPPVLDLRTIKELCQPTLNGRGRPIAPIAIQATNFGLKNDMIQQVQNSFQFHGLPGDDANKHLDKFLHVTQSIKFDRLPSNSINTFEQMAKMFLGNYFPPSMVTKLKNKITKFRQRPDESLFKAWERYKLSIDRFPNHNVLPITQIDTFYNGLTLRHRDTINAAAGGTFMKRRPEECYDLIENMTAHHNDWDTSAQRSESSSSITSSSDPKIVALKAEMAEINKNLMKVLQINQQVKAVTPNCKTYGGPYSYNDCPTTVGQTQNANDVILKNKQTNMTSLRNSNLELKNMFGQFMKMNTASSSSSGTLPSNTITNPKEDFKGITTRSETAYQGPTIPTTSSSLPQVVERETEMTKDTLPPTNNGSTKDVQPPVVQTETPIPNYEPVEAPVSTPKPNPKLSIPYPSRLHDQKLRDKANDQKEKFFQIFQDLNFNISFVDALILMLKFGPTIKILLTNKDKLYELARTPLNEHCSAVLLKKLPEKLGDLGKFLIPCDFLRMDECLAPAYLGASINLMQSSVWNKLSLPKLSPTCMTLKLMDRLISCPAGVAKDVFVKTERALIDVYAGELTLRVNNEAVTFNIDQTSRYSAIYNDMKVVDAFLALEDDPTSPKVDHSYYDTEGDILLLKAFLNEDPSLPPPTQGIYLPQIRKELKICKAKNDKSSIDEPPEVELKDIPPHLEYTFLEGWRVCIEYLKLNEATRKDHFPLPFMDQMLERLVRNVYYCFLDGVYALNTVTFKFSSILKINKRPHSRVLTERLPIVACLLGYAMHQARSKGEKSHFMVKEGIVLSHKISKNRIEVDKAKVDVIAKLPHPTTIKGIRSFLGHASFY
nr:reverse transcriptase domain-containing protein [Tanacetum cinerariifolium]